MRKLFLAPNQPLKSFGKSTDPNHNSFTSSTRISTKYPQFPSSLSESRRGFSPEPQPRSGSASNNSSKDFKFNPGKNGHVGRAGEPISVAIPSRSRSFMRGSQFGSSNSSKRSGSEEPVVGVNQGNHLPVRFNNAFPNSSQMGFPVDGTDGGRHGRVANLNELSIITSQDIGKDRSLNPLNGDHLGNFRSNSSVRSDTDYSNSTLPRQIGQVNAIKL